MQKIISLVLVLVMCLSLCACGKSEAVKNVEAMIAAIDTVSIENLDAVYSAMNAYDALSKEDAEKVKNYDAMTDALDQWLEANLPRQWVYQPTYFHDIEEMYNKVDLTLNEDGSAVGNHVSGPWRVEDGVLKIDAGKSDYVYYTFFEDGKLSVGSTGTKMIPVEEYRAMLDDMFMSVEITPENVADYCEIVIYTEIDDDDFGVVTGDTRTYPTLASKVYDKGLIYFEGSDDLAIELLIPEHTYQYQSRGRKWRTQTDEADEFVFKRTPYGSSGPTLGHKSVKNEYEAIHDITAEQITFGRVTGKIVFVRSEYVKNVTKDTNSSSRLLVLSNDIEVHSGSWKDGLKY